MLYFLKKSFSVVHLLLPFTAVFLAGRNTILDGTDTWRRVTVTTVSLGRSKMTWSMRLWRETHELLASAWSGWAIIFTSLNSEFLYDLLFGITNLMLHKLHHSGIPHSLQSFLGGSHSQSVRFDKRKNLVSLLRIDTRFLGLPFRSVAAVPHNVSNNLKTKTTIDFVSQTENTGFLCRRSPHSKTSEWTVWEKLRMQKSFYVRCLRLRTYLTGILLKSSRWPYAVHLTWSSSRVTYFPKFCLHNDGVTRCGHFTLHVKIWIIQRQISEHTYHTWNF